MQRNIVRVSRDLLDCRLLSACGAVESRRDARPVRDLALDPEHMDN